MRPGQELADGGVPVSPRLHPRLRWARIPDSVKAHSKLSSVAPELNSVDELMSVGSRPVLSKKLVRLILACRKGHIAKGEVDSARRSLELGCDTARRREKPVPDALPDR